MESAVLNSSLLAASSASVKREPSAVLTPGMLRRLVCCVDLPLQLSEIKVSPQVQLAQEITSIKHPL